MKGAYWVSVLVPVSALATGAGSRWTTARRAVQTRRRPDPAEAGVRTTRRSHMHFRRPSSATISSTFRAAPPATRLPRAAECAVRRTPARARSRTTRISVFGQGGIKAPTVFSNDCLTTDTRLIINATLSSSTCQSAMDTACGEVSGPTPAIATETIRSCVQSNSPNSYYPINWDVYAKRVECPTHMMEVTVASSSLPTFPQPIPP